MRMKPLVTALLGLFLCGTVAAAEYPPAVQSLVDQGITIVEQFDAQAGLTGYVIKVKRKNDTMYGIVYGLADGKYVLVGRLLDANGNNITAAQAKKYTPKPDLSKAWQKLEQSTWFAEGAENPETIIYVFSDPNCPYCHLAWLANQPYMDVGLQVRHIVVGFLTPSSKYRAAAILEADNPTAAFRKNEKNYRFDVPEDQAGGIEPLKDPDPATLKKIKANAQLMFDLGVRGTPGIFYKDDNGKVHSIAGLPSLSQLPKIYDLPEQPINDPRLEEYK